MRILAQLLVAAFLGGYTPLSAFAQSLWGEKIEFISVLFGKQEKVFGYRWGAMSTVCRGDAQSRRGRARDRLSQRAARL